MVEIELKLLGSSTFWGNRRANWVIPAAFRAGLGGKTARNSRCGG